MAELNDILKEALASARIDGSDEDDEETDDEEDEGWEDDGGVQGDPSQEMMSKQAERNSKLGMELSKILNQPGKPFLAERVIVFPFS